MSISKIKNFFLNFIKNLINKEQNDHKLALAVAIGTYIGFCPLPGLHTILTFVLAWALSVNVAIVFAVSLLIHNPWTMMPVYALDVLAGSWFCKTFLGTPNLMYLNPGWMTWLNSHLAYYTGLKGICLWSFLIGGNLLAIGLALLVYPIMRFCFARFTLRQSSKE